MPGSGTGSAGAAATGGFAGKLASILGPIGMALDVGAQIASLIPRPDRNKIEAAGTQQNLEQVALDIERRVNSGELDPDSALTAIQSLEVRAAGLPAGVGAEAGPAYARAGVNANNIIQQVKANIVAKRTAALSAPIDQEKGLTGSPRFQAQQFGTALRNRLIGANSAAGLAGTPADRLVQPRPSPTGSVGRVRDLVAESFPSGGGFEDELRRRLSQSLSAPARY